jgi:hypothetical protein
VGDVLRGALSFFLVVTAVALAYALIRAARTLDRVSDAIDTATREGLPVLEKAGETLDQVSGQLAHAERITGTAAGAVSSVDRAVRRVVRRPRSE